MTREEFLQKVRKTFKGSEHYAWKGDAARKESKRERCQRLYVLGPCEICGQQGRDRHHKDGDTGNNSRENVVILCRPCHMKADGRAQRLSQNAIANGLERRLPPKECTVCQRLAKPLRRGRCGACNEFFRLHGRDILPHEQRTHRYGHMMTLGEQLAHLKLRQEELDAKRTDTRTPSQG